VIEAARLKFTTPCDVGHVFQRERIALLADRCCQAIPGDLIEIGAYQGGTSVVLAQVARKHKRRLICVDDFKAGCSWNLDQIEPRFLEAIEPYRDVIDYLKMDAHHPDTIAAIQARRYCAAFSDDGHSIESHISELTTLLPVVDGLVIVDDTDYPGVKEAVYAVVPRFPGWTVIENASLSELYCMRTR
jgi:hypothetical protein